MLKDMVKNTAIKFLECKNTSQIIEGIKEYEYVSFDIFDTLIKRNLNNPEDVFDLVEQEYNKLYKSDLENYRNIRMQSEKRALLLTEREDITIDEIFNCMDMFSEEIKLRLKFLELDIEEKISIEHKTIKEVFYDCLSKGKKVILISDMYLPREIIENLLEINGYRGFSKLYISSEVGFKKSTGKLYEYVLNDLKIVPKNIIHIGDNLKGDFIHARRNKIKSLLINRQANYRRFNFKRRLALKDKELKQYLQLNSFINNNIELKQSEYYNFGFEIFGPLLYGFTKWLLVELKKDDIKKIFFFSRDGYILKKVFEIINEELDFQVNYLYVSRRSIKVPFIWKMHSYKEVVDFVIGKEKVIIEYFLHNLGLKFKDYQEEVQKLGINIDDSYTKGELLTNAKCLELYKLLERKIVNNSKSQYELLIRYLRQEQFEGKAAAIDIGWNGSMQDNLVNNLDMNQLKGYYVGLSSKANNKNKKSYLFGSNNPHKDIYSSFIGIFEMIFLAPEGTTLNYHYSNERVIPILDKHEFTDSTGELDKIIQIQNGALDFIKKYKKQQTGFMDAISSQVYFNDLLCFGRRPKLEEVNFFSDFQFVDGAKVYIAKPQKITSYIISPRKLINDFYKSPWKIGFLKKLIKLPLKYYKIYDFLKNR